ncbi:phosphoenolpyruvate carboxykinase [Clostridium grantii]|uniref:Phosphoenolpyruvate carboxykinase n=1 Tax=Clostridium grantii DSM 8605 TaxID=1121316 RepID=A0A1M5SN51_9CLOT|nr:phosphoenolpyruvate carboxykinase [Clostridium grantii]SHH39999.1 hypothetical protein SAMN02745207_01034 [Clostridium grantii DSM 8605]
MKKEFSLSKGKAMINFTAKFCTNSESLLHSYGFYRVLESYLKSVEKKQSKVYKYLASSFNTTQFTESIMNDIIKILSLLMVLDVDEVSKTNEQFKNLLSDKDSFLDFVEKLYNYWRKIERYTIIKSSRVNKNGYQNVSFIDANETFTNVIRTTYRKIEENVRKHHLNIYRQLPAGGNAGLILNSTKWPMPTSYTLLKDIPFIESIVISPPFITYPKKNTRNGIFNEVFENPLTGVEIDEDHWFCYPAKVGELLAYIYFHRDLMAHGVTLCNLFEMATVNEYKNKKPDLVYVYGCKDNCEEVTTVFYDDKENDIMLGYANYSDDVDYFGYMKKMMLTLHNLIMIKRGFLPIHGAMVNIVTKNGNSSNIIIMGDSGAGKSESLEAFRRLSEDYISEMTIIFDDMGTVKLDGDNKPMGYGTEIGAFVRLDDLDSGYAFREMDRSVFMNPDKVNARLVIPVATYKEIMKGYPIDLFLYANNYDEGEYLDFFEDIEEAKKVFTAGARMTKGTTTETGLVTSYFANPFGPVQKKEETDILIDSYFKKFYETGVQVGQLRTCLGIAGKEKTGTTEAATKLLEIIKNADN